MTIFVVIKYHLNKGEKKGHFPANMHIDVLKQVEKRLPKGASVVIGDGEFDSVALQPAVAQLQWEYVCRTANNLQVYDEGEWVSLRTGHSYLMVASRRTNPHLPDHQLEFPHFSVHKIQHRLPLP